MKKIQKIFLIPVAALVAFGCNGSWGALKWYDQTSSPKHDALMQWIQDNPQWW